MYMHKLLVNANKQLKIRHMTTGADCAIPLGLLCVAPPADDPLVISTSPVMARRDRSHSPESANKRVRPSHRSPRSPSPTRRSQRPSDRDRERDRERDRDRARDKDREHDRRSDRRDRDRDRPRDRDHDDRRRRSRSRDRRDRDRDRERGGRDGRDRRSASPPQVKALPKVENGAGTPDSKAASPAPEDDKIKARKAKLEAWKKAQAKTTVDDAKARSMALAGKSFTSGTSLLSSLPSKPTSHHLISCSCLRGWRTQSSGF
jgi:ATP-dependent RNA helicase DDX46/PRP5